MEVKQPIQYPKSVDFLMDSLSLPEPLKHDPKWDGLYLYSFQENVNCVCHNNIIFS